MPSSYPIANSIRPPTSDAFKRPPSRPMSQQNGRVTTPKPSTPKPQVQATLRYTSSAQGSRQPSAQSKPDPVAPARATPPPTEEPASSPNTF